MEVTWGAVVQEHYKAGLIVRALDSRGVLAKVALAVAALGGDISKAEVETSPDKRARIKLALRVKDIQQLRAIEKEIAAAGEILSVERV